jgi:hypothetical protein
MVGAVVVAKGALPDVQAVADTTISTATVVNYLLVAVQMVLVLVMMDR